MEIDILEAADILITLPHNKKYVKISINNNFTKKYSKYYCEECKTTFTRKFHLLRHKKNIHREYIVEKILDIKFNKQRKKTIENCIFLIKWEGYSKNHNTWEPFSNVKHLKNLSKLFNKKFR